MKTRKIADRMAELEQKANSDYCDNVDWDERLECLTKEEQKEWKELFRKLNGVDY